MNEQIQQMEKGIKELEKDINTEKDKLSKLEKAKNELSESMDFVLVYTSDQYCEKTVYGEVKQGIVNQNTFEADQEDLHKSLESQKAYPNSFKVIYFTPSHEYGEATVEVYAHKKNTPDGKSTINTYIADIERAKCTMKNFQSEKEKLQESRSKAWKNRNEALRQQSEMRKKLLENNKKDIEKLEKKTVELMDTIEQAVQKLQLKKTNHQEKHEQYLMPCVQGIIQNVKVHYRRFLLSERITAIDDNTDYKMDLLKALHFLRRAWSNVKPETIANCFRKAGFVKSVETTVDTANDTDEMFDELMANLGEEVQETGCEVDEMKSLWADLQAMELVDGEFDDYLAVDDQLAIEELFLWQILWQAYQELKLRDPILQWNRHYGHRARTGANSHRSRSHGWIQCFQSYVERTSKIRIFCQIAEQYLITCSSINSQKEEIQKLTQTSDHVQQQVAELQRQNTEVSELSTDEWSLVKMNEQIQQMEKGIKELEKDINTEKDKLSKLEKAKNELSESMDFVLVYTSDQYCEKTVYGEVKQGIVNQNTFEADVGCPIAEVKCLSQCISIARGSPQKFGVTEKPTPNSFKVIYFTLHMNMEKLPWRCMPTRRIHRMASPLSTPTLLTSSVLSAP
uniref:DDE-1 domain-containing protein n=1 Tax=Ditylenchus dipsaci TaxID=166011 RepID=A0A915DAH7_9BILA